MRHKTILITGATSGFGQACARRFAQDGWSLILIGRRRARLEDLAHELGADRIHWVALDLRDAKGVQAMLNELPPGFEQIDVLLNNAGLALGLAAAQEANLSDWQTMIDTNITALCALTHAVLPKMAARNCGHIVNMGSVAGTYPYPGGNVYGASKAFVKQFSRNLLADLAHTALRVTNIEPGLAESEFSVVRFHGDTQKAKAVYAGAQPLTPVDIAEIVFWVCSAPSHVNICTVEVMPVCQSCGPLYIHRRKEAA